LGSSGGRTQLKCVLLGRTQLNIFSLGLVAQPNPISIYLKTKFKKIQKHQKYYFEVKKTIKKIEIFFKAFLKCKNKNASIKKFNPT
jgi:predicted AAA+ superfamily ATPase